MSSMQRVAAALRTRDWPSTWWDTLALGLLALAVAGHDLGSPPALVFDELYYVSDAYSHLEVGVGRGFQAHPPLGTWLIAAGIAIVDSPVGWRLASLVAGVLAVTALHRLALSVFDPGPRGRLLSLVAGVLLITDGSWLVLSRTAMLDGPLTALVVLSTTLGVTATRRDQLDWRRLVLAGAAAGLALAVKWSGAVVVPLLFAVFAITARAAPISARLRAALPPTLLITGVAMVIYTASWVPFATNRGDVPVGDCPVVAAPCPEDGGIDGVVAQHEMLVRYHSRIESDSEITSPPSGWPLLRDPIGFYRPDCHLLSLPVELPASFDPPAACEEDLPDGLDTVLYRGNVVVWLGFVALLPVLLGAARRGHLAAQVALAGWVLQWLPWLLATRSSYLWYMAPTVPFLALGLAAMAVALPGTPVSRAYLHGGVLAALGAAIAVLTPVPGAVVIVGWAFGGLTATRPTNERIPAVRTDAVIIAGVISVAATAVAVVSHSSWTVA